jgi:hypothetical protein
MLRSIKLQRVLPVAALVVAAVIIGVGAVSGAASPGAGSNATELLQQTFSGAHNIQSGVLNLSLAVTPTGGTATTPFQLTVNGPFELSGAGKWPALDLTATASGFGQTGSLGVISTGDAAYVTLGGVNYAVPARELRRFDHWIARAHRQLLAHARTAAVRHARRHGRDRTAAAHGSGNGGDLLSQLGINPLAWLVNPSVVSTNVSVGGVQTTEVQAGIDVATLAKQLYSGLLARGHGQTRLPAGLPIGLLAGLGAVHATVQVYAGNADQTLRELVIDVTAPIPGMPGTQPGAISGVHVVLTIQLNDLNQPQTISAPANVQPFGALRMKLRSMLGGLGSLLGAGDLPKLLRS